MILNATLFFFISMVAILCGIVNNQVRVLKLCHNCWHLGCVPLYKYI